MRKTSLVPLLVSLAPWAIAMLLVAWFGRPAAFEPAAWYSVSVLEALPSYAAYASEEGAV